MEDIAVIIKYFDEIMLYSLQIKIKQIKKRRRLMMWTGMAPEH